MDVLDSFSLALKNEYLNKLILMVHNTLETVHLSSKLNYFMYTGYQF
jgi:hypothetical protein